MKWNRIQSSSVLAVFSSLKCLQLVRGLLLQHAIWLSLFFSCCTYDRTFKRPTATATGTRPCWRQSRRCSSSATLPRLPSWSPAMNRLWKRCAEPGPARCCALLAATSSSSSVSDDFNRNLLLSFIRCVQCWDKRPGSRQLPLQLNSQKPEKRQHRIVIN